MDHPQKKLVTWFDASTRKHLRLAFSFHLLPIFLFAVSQATSINWTDVVLSFIILHFFVYPSSNGYNSYQDKDETSIGGLEHPPKVTKNLLYVTFLLDILAIVLSLFISIYFAVCVLILILASRAYSFRNIRLKQYPFFGFLTVCVFQGAFTYFMASLAISSFPIASFFSVENLMCAGIASLFIGSFYPLTQIYQHKADEKDGVITLSYKLGYTGTFVFSALLFAGATILLYCYFELKHQRIAVLLFSIIMLPVVLRFMFWYGKVNENEHMADFKNTMRMTMLSSTCMNIYFLVLIANNFLAWF